MSLIIAIDIGNTNTKIGNISNNAISIPNYLIGEDYVNSKLSDIILDNASAIKLSVSSVLDNVQTQYVVNLIQQCLVIQSQVKIWASGEILKKSGIANTNQLLHLGSDRALKIYYVQQLAKSGTKINFSCGSAFTVEVVSDNKLIASYILPGLSMQLNSLSLNTAKLPHIKPENIPEVLMTHEELSTQLSIVNGVLMSYIALIERLISCFNPSDIILSGGFANVIYNKLSKPMREIITLKQHLELDILIELARFSDL